MSAIPQTSPPVCRVPQARTSTVFRIGGFGGMSTFPPLSLPLSSEDRGFTRPWRWHLRDLLRTLNIRIERNFRRFLDPLPCKHFQQLKANIADDRRVRLNLVAWDGLLLDGH